MGHENSDFLLPGVQRGLLFLPASWTGHVQQGSLPCSKRDPRALLSLKENATSVWLVPYQKVGNGLAEFLVAGEC